MAGMFNEDGKWAYRFWWKPQVSRKKAIYLLVKTSHVSRLLLILHIHNHQRNFFHQYRVHQCTLSTVYARQGLMYSWHAYIILIGKPMQLVPHSVHCTLPFIGSLDQRQCIGTFLPVFVPSYKAESSFVNVRLNLRILIFFALMSMCCFSVNIFICSLLH